MNYFLKAVFKPLLLLANMVFVGWGLATFVFEAFNPYVSYMELNRSILTTEIVYAAAILALNAVWIRRLMKK